MNEITNLDWAYVRSQALAKLDSLRMQNDQVSLDPASTAALRGEIRALKWLLDLPTAAALKSQTPPPFNGGEQF